LRVGIGPAPEMPLLTELENIILGLQATNITPLTGLGETPVPRRLPRRQASQRRRRDLFVGPPAKVPLGRYIWGDHFSVVFKFACGYWPCAGDAAPDGA
jgi:hypothetical protein